MTLPEAFESAPKSDAGRPEPDPDHMSEEWSKWRQQMLAQYGEAANYAICIASLKGAVSSGDLYLSDLTSLCRSAVTAREKAKEERQEQLLDELREEYDAAVPFPPP